MIVSVRHLTCFALPSDPQSHAWRGRCARTRLVVRRRIAERRARAATAAIGQPRNAGASSVSRRPLAERENVHLAAGSGAPSQAGFCSRRGRDAGAARSARPWAAGPLGGRASCIVWLPSTLRRTTPVSAAPGSYRGSVVPSIPVPCARAPVGPASANGISSTGGLKSLRRRVKDDRVLRLQTGSGGADGCHSRRTSGIA